MPAEQTIHLEKYSPEARALVASAQSLADERKHAQVEPVHLLARALDRDRGSADVFRKAGAEPADVAVEAEAAGPFPPPVPAPCCCRCCCCCCWSWNMPAGLRGGGVAS